MNSRSRRCVLTALLALALASPLHGAPQEGDDPKAGDPKAEDPAVVQRRKRLELDERRDKLADTAKPYMEKLDSFRDQEFRVWSTRRDHIAAGGKDAVPALLIALEELDWETRAFAASCLAEIGDLSSAAHVVDAYRRENKYVEARRQYVLAIDAIGAASTKGFLEEASAESDPGVRLAAVRALGRFEDPALADDLRRFTKVENDLDLRYEALGALAALGEDETIDGLIAECEALVADRKLERLVSSKNWDDGDRYRQYVLGLALARANATGKKAKKIEKILLGALLAKKPWDHKDFLRMGVAEGMGRREEALHPKLLAGINDKDRKARIACTFAAGFALDEGTVSRLTKVLGDTQMDVRHNAVVALGGIGTPEAVKGLRKALGDKRGEIRIGAVRALGGVWSPESTQSLVKALDDEKYMLRVMAAKQLAKRVDEPGVISALKKRAGDKDYGVRAQALAALAHTKNPDEVVETMVRALDDRDFGVQANACLGLAALGPDVDYSTHEQEVRYAVRLYLETDHARLHRGAEEFLDAVRPPACVPPLLEALGSTVLEVRKRANLGLKRVSETSRNFDPEGPKAARDAAQKRWRKWWAEVGKLPRRGSRARAVITGKLVDVSRDLKWKGLDIALLFDSTGSMAGLIRAAKDRIDEIIYELGGLLPSLRVSVYTYRDRDTGDAYVYYGTPLTYDTWKLKGFLQNAVHGGGGDLPEAVYETFRSAVENLHWRENAHKVIVYAGDATHHPEDTTLFIEAIKEFCTVKNQAALHAIFTDTKRRSLDIKARKQRIGHAKTRYPVFEMYQRTAQAGRGKAVMLDDETALIKELLVMAFGEAWRADIENLLDFRH